MLEKILNNPASIAYLVSVGTGSYMCVNGNAESGVWLILGFTVLWGVGSFIKREGKF